MTTATTTAPTEDVGFFARKVTALTGLSELKLDRLHTSDMGSPGHFMLKNPGGMFYTLKGLCRLVEILHAEGMKAEGEMLSREVDTIRPRPVRPVAPAGRKVRGNWALDWENRQDSAA